MSSLRFNLSLLFLTACLFLNPQFEIQNSQLLPYALCSMPSHILTYFRDHGGSRPHRELQPLIQDFMQVFTHKP